jgi:hypothetical protein
MSEQPPALVSIDAVAEPDDLQRLEVVPLDN